MVLSSLLISFSSSNSFQISTAKPAAMAAPSAVVSLITGLSTGIPIMYLIVSEYNDVLCEHEIERLELRHFDLCIVDRGLHDLR